MIPTSNAPHPHLVIEWTAERWEIAREMAQAVEAEGKDYPRRLDTLAEPFALHAFFWVWPDNSPRGYHLQPADAEQYDKMMLDRLANASLEEVGSTLDGHLQNSTDREGFLQYLQNMIANDSKLLTPWDYISMEVYNRSFETALTWIAIKQSIQVGTPKKAEAEDVLEARALTHRGYMLLLYLMGVHKQLEKMKVSPKGRLFADLLGLNVRRSQDILRAESEFSPDYMFAPKVVEEVYQYCKELKSLDTPFGRAAIKLREEMIASGKN